jgi:hypothetical protein
MRKCNGHEIHVSFIFMTCPTEFSLQYIISKTDGHRQMTRLIGTLFQLSTAKTEKFKAVSLIKLL